jgi:myosin V
VSRANDSSDRRPLPPTRTFIDFSDNQPCIDLIEGKLGILSLLDEESRLPSGSDPSFAQKLYTTLGKPEYADVFRKPRFGSSAFTVAHYALDVTYETEGFLEKNRDTVPDEHLALLSFTSNAFLKEVLDRALAPSLDAKPELALPEPGSKRSSFIDSTVSKRSSVIGGPSINGNVRKVGATARKPTLGSIFKLSLASLMDTISTTNAHYIRCIKPNENKLAWNFEPQMVLAQLRACGVLETIRISTAGYPTRWTFEEFAER